MACLWKRLTSKGKNWRHVYKALTVLEYLVANGSERILIDVWEHMDELQALSTDFEYIEPPPPYEKDQGVNVRKKAEMLVALLHDKNKVADLRLKAAANQHKYYGIASSSLLPCSSQQAEGWSKYPQEDAMPSAITGAGRERGIHTRRGSAPPTYDETLEVGEGSILPTVKMQTRRGSAPSSFEYSTKALTGKKVESTRPCPSNATNWHRDQYGRSASLPSSAIPLGGPPHRDKYGRSASVPAINQMKKPANVPYYDDDDDDQFDPRR